MRSFNASIQVSSILFSDLKIAAIPTWLQRLREHAGDAGRPRTSSQLLFESIERFRVTLRERLHTTVGQIADPTRQTFLTRCLFDKKPEADTLHPTAHRELSSRRHRDSIELYG